MTELVQAAMRERLLPPGGIAATLTHREQVVLDLVGQGLTASTIAGMIGVGRVRVYQIQRAALAKQAVQKFAGSSAPTSSAAA